MDLRRRALLAVLVGAVGATVGVAGLGHAYLRQWRRAVTWFVFVLGAGVVLVLAFADPATATPEDLPLTVVLPVFALLTASIVDAYYVASRRASGAGATGNLPSCPHCGKDIDPDIAFCWYCSEPLDGSGGADPGGLEDRHGPSRD